MGKRSRRDGGLAIPLRIVPLPGLAPGVPLLAALLVGPPLPAPPRPARPAGARAPGVDEPPRPRLGDLRLGPEHGHRAGVALAGAGSDLPVRPRPRGCRARGTG